MNFFKNIFLLALIGGTVFVGYKNFFEPQCFSGLEYSIGRFDEDFGLRKDVFKRLIMEAEELWEKEAGRNIFTYKEGADFKINLIFGEEQEHINNEINLRGGLDDIEYKLRRAENAYAQEKKSYDANIVRYNKDYNAYNNEVVSWNEKGGAPQDVYNKLAQKKKALDQRSVQLESQRKKLNALAKENNDVVNSYNSKVGHYNNLFSNTKEFDAGNTDGTEINIHSYKNADELRSVIAHEFGHVLGIDHLEDESSLMYYLLNTKNSHNILSEFDKKALDMVCKIKLQ